MLHTSSDVLSRLGLRLADAPYGVLRQPAFPVSVPLAYVKHMRPDWHDPLLLQVLPRAEEDATRPGFSPDAVGDRSAMVAPGLLHKYQGRALLLASAACPLHCRYCTRRCFPLADVPRSAAQWQPALRWLASRPDITEVILSGGDPLMLQTSRLTWLVGRLLALRHLTGLRIHTRVPVAQPDRVTAPVVKLLKAAAGRLRLVVVIHANHAAELGDDCADALGRLHVTGALLLNQSVLLAGINDSAGALADLSRRLAAVGVLPYYLHQLDRVSGTAHFEVDERKGRAVVAELRRRLPGYLVPRYVRETAGDRAKAPLA